MRSVRLDDTGSSKGLWVQHPMGKSPRPQSVAPTESPYQHGGCYSTHVTVTLMTFHPSEAYNSVVGLAPSPLALSICACFLPKKVPPAFRGAPGYQSDRV
jgi:hypothetical protein